MGMFECIDISGFLLKELIIMVIEYVGSAMIIAIIIYFILKIVINDDEWRDKK